MNNRLKTQRTKRLNLFHQVTFTWKTFCYKVKQWFNLIPLKTSLKKNLTYDRPAAWSHSQRLMQTVPVFTWASLLHPNSGYERGGEKKQKQLLHQMLYSWRVSDALTQRSLEMWRRSSSRSLPWRPAPARSQKPPIPRTSERQQRPDGTCSSSPRRLSSIVWFPEDEWRKHMGGLRYTHTHTMWCVCSRQIWVDGSKSGRSKLRGTIPLIISHLLFEVAPLLFINQHQIQVVAHWKLLVDVSHRGGQVVASQEQPDGNGFTWEEKTDSLIWTPQERNDQPCRPCGLYPWLELHPWSHTWQWCHFHGRHSDQCPLSPVWWCQSPCAWS